MKPKYNCARCGKIVTNEDCIVTGLNNRKEHLCEECYKIVFNGTKRSSVKYYGKALSASHFRVALESYGLDLTLPDLKETPERMARVFEEYTSALSQEWQDRKDFIFSRKFPSSYDEMVTFGKNSDPIKANSLCPHHFLPVHMKVYVSYLPIKWVIGLSKLVEYIVGESLQPILQEELTKRIAEDIQKYLKPLGVGVVIEARHDCMGIRDVKQSIPVITTCLLGAYKLKPETRAEFLNSIK